MLDSKQREAQLLQARERLARAFTRLEAIVGDLPDRIRQLESTHDKSAHRIKEIEELLERERAITSQRQLLSDGAAEQVHALNQKLEKSEKLAAERDKKIAESEKNLIHKENELLAYEKSHVDSLEREQKFAETTQRLEEESAAIIRQLELMKEERESLQKQLGVVEEKDNSYALAFTQDERLSLLKTVDTLIERIDTLAHVDQNK